MRIAVFGATGRTGRPLVEQAVERGHEVVAFVRDATGLPSTLRNDDRVSVVEGDAYTGESVDRAVAGDGDPVDAVVSVLGQTSDGPDDLLTEAGHHMLAAMRRHGVERVVTLVGAGVREDGESVSLGGRVMNALLKLLAGSVLEDARAQVELIKDGDARWTVVRGSRLTEDAHTGEFRHGTDLSLGGARHRRAGERGRVHHRLSRRRPVRPRDAEDHGHVTGSVHTAFRSSPTRCETGLL